MKNWLKAFAIFFVLGLLLYCNGWNNKFVIDDYFFSSNPVKADTEYVFHQWPFHQELASSFLANSVWFNRPLAYIALDLYFAAVKNNLWEYHLVNLLLFVLVTSLIYALVERTTGNNNLAFFASLFFLVHPINGIIVNNISSGYFSVVMALILGAILLLLESLEKNNLTLYCLSLLFLFLSLFWHEMGILAPLYLSSVILLFRKDTNRAKFIYLFPYFLIVFFYIVFRAFLFAPNGSALKAITLYHMTGLEYPAALFGLYAWYISKLFYPHGIVMLWAQPISHDHIILNALGFFSLFMAFLLLFARFSKEKICQLALAWIFIGFAPVCLAAFRTPQEGAIIEPHWFIFSSIGFFILIAYFCLALFGRMRAAGLVLLFIIIFFWGSACHAYNQLWKDQTTYALYWSQQNPYLKKTYNYLAEAYKRQGALKESGKYYRMALTGDPADEIIYINLENIDMAEGHYKAAEADCKMALNIDPSSAGTYDNLGAIYYTEGRLDLARENLERSLALDPLLTQPRVGLATIFLKQAEYQKALNLCFKNLGIVNDDTETLFLLMDIYAVKKDVVNLRKYAYRVLNYKTDPEILMRLGDELAGMNINDIAMDCYTKVLRVAPDYKDAYYGAGKLFAGIGRYDAAIHLWQLGSNIDPSDQRFEQGIDRAMGLKNKGL